MTEDDTEDELWSWMTRQEFRALNDDDRARALAALRRRVQDSVSTGEPFSLSGRVMTSDEVAQADRSRHRRAERMSRPPYDDGDTRPAHTGRAQSSEGAPALDKALDTVGGGETAEAETEDRRLTMDLVALYDITRDFAVQLEYHLLEHEDAATDEEIRRSYNERRLAVKRERRNLPLGMDLAARTGLIAAQDTWRAEIEALRCL